MPCFVSGQKPFGSRSSCLAKVGWLLPSPLSPASLSPASAHTIAGLRFEQSRETITYEKNLQPGKAHSTSVWWVLWYCEHCCSTLHLLRAPGISGISGTSGTSGTSGCNMIFHQQVHPCRHPQTRIVSGALAGSAHLHTCTFQKQAPFSAVDPPYSTRTGHRPQGIQPRARAATLRKACTIRVNAR